MSPPEPPRSLVGFNPGREAEPTSQESTEEENPAPSVLNKLQKWADYQAMGSPVWPTRFVPCKTPMSNEILENWSLAEAPRHALTVPVLLEAQAAEGRQVGLIIDLANHDCLYSDDMPDCLEYEHVQLVAKVLPSREAINEVQRIATSFWNDHPDQYIAIHCAYGFNRTGFVVCSFLCQACGLTVNQALESFAASRPPGVKHEKFIRELYARYGGGTASCTASRTASPATSPPKDAPPLGAPPPPERVDGLAAEAELLLQHGAAAAAIAAAQLVPSVTGGSAAAGGSPAASMPPHAGLARAQLAPGEEEDHHFEDAADMVRRSSQQRLTLSVRSGSGGGDALPPSASPAACTSRPGSRPGSACSSRNASRHGGSVAVEAAAGGGEAPPQEDGASDEAVASLAGSDFAASRRLLQRKPSRGGALAQALAGSGSGSEQPVSQPHPAASCGTSDPGGASPESGQRTGASSMSDFASAAAHLEGRAGSGSMRRATSLGLARALSEDFLQNNGTPNAGAPISALGSAQLAAMWAAQAVGCQPPADALHEGQQAATRQQQQGLEPADAVPEPADTSVCVAATQRCGGVAELKAGSPPKLGSSPSRRGGIPLPALRAAAAPPGTQPQAQHLPQCTFPHQQQQSALLDGTSLLGQPGTPATPASSAALSVLGSTGQRQGFPRSVSLDSDNPSLGFGMREALHHLRLGTAPGASNVRGPQALADLFRQDSRGELSEADVEEHLAALARASGGDSPSVPGPLPRVVEDAAAAALLRGGIVMPAATGLAAQQQQQGPPVGAQGARVPLPKGQGTCAMM